MLVYPLYSIHQHCMSTSTPPPPLFAQGPDDPPKVSGNVANPKIYGLSRNQRVVFLKALMRYGAQRDPTGAFDWPSGTEHITPKVLEAMHAYGRKVRGMRCLGCAVSELAGVVCAHAPTDNAW